MGTKKLMLWIFSIAIQNMYIYKGHRRETNGFFFQKGRGLTAISKMAFFLNYQILAIMHHRKSG